MNFGSLFAGIGGIDLGLERAGMTCKWQVENDPFCNKVLEKRWPAVRRYGDIKELDPNELEPVDLISGGFPCQPFSYAGRRKAQDDDRWLWPFFADTISALRPRYAVLENVPGLFTAGFDDVLADLASLGYDTEWDCLPAAAFGAHHRRDRLVVVAHTHRVGLRNESVTECWCSDSSLFTDDGAQRVVADADRLVGSSPKSRTNPETSPSELVNGTNGRDGRGGTLGDWLPEPEMGRVVDGIPDRLVRYQLKALGNAVVPQVAEFVGRKIVTMQDFVHNDSHEGNEDG